MSESVRSEDPRRISIQNPMNQKLRKCGGTDHGRELRGERRTVNIAKVESESQASVLSPLP